MSKIYEDEFGVYISHENYIDRIYKHIESDKTWYINPSIFNVTSQYRTHRCNKKPKNSKNRDYETGASLQKEQEVIKAKFYKFVENLLPTYLSSHGQSDASNTDALEAAQLVYHESEKALVKNTIGSNIGPATIHKIGNSNFLFPKDSVFFCKDVIDIDKYLNGKQYNLILLDPPWWNKYIRRKRKKSSDAYNMMFNHELKKIPIKDLLEDSGLVVVWCTNSSQNLRYLQEEILPHWGVKFVSKWYWLKIAKNGEPVCNFSPPPGKQPYEQIIIGCREGHFPDLQNEKLVVSVPSAIHSHKPPLSELLEPYLPERPNCLEIFARYLLPGWTSYGNEVLRFQHESLYCRK